MRMSRTCGCPHTNFWVLAPVFPVCLSKLPKRPAISMRMEQARASTEHEVVDLGNNKLHCRACMARSPPAGEQLVLWLNTQCRPHDAAWMAQTKPHPGHHLVQGKGSLVFCSRCGAWSSAMYRALLRPCGGLPPTYAHAFSLRQLMKGRSPLGEGVDMPEGFGCLMQLHTRVLSCWRSKGSIARVHRLLEVRKRPPDLFLRSWDLSGGLECWW